MKLAQEQLAEVQSDLLQLKRSHCGNAVCQVDGDAGMAGFQVNAVQGTFGDIWRGICLRFSWCITYHMLRLLYVSKRDEIKWANLMLTSSSLIWFQENIFRHV